MALGVRTVQRYEANLGLPIRRPPGGNRCAVWAFADEIDAWLKSPGRIRGAESDYPEEQTDAQLRASAKDAERLTNESRSNNGSSHETAQTMPSHLRAHVRAA